MSHVVTLVNDHLVYDGILSSKEKATIDDILVALKKEIPEIESELEKEYGQTVMYKYNLGLILGNLLERYDISVSERRKFWDEIKNLASKEVRKRNEGSKSVTRSFYQQCYVLSRYDIDVVKKLTWRQWQDILDRVGNREDERIFRWIRQLNEKIREDDWREFEKALNIYLRGKDTSVFNDDELFGIYDSIMLMCKKWRCLFVKFVADHPKSSKIKNKSSWSKKYYVKCFDAKRTQRSATITESICDETFKNLMY